MESNSTTKIAKNQTAKVGDKYSYKYVDIAQIHDYLESINARYIQKIQRIDGDDYVMTKRCFNNQWDEEWLQGCKVVDATLVGVKNPAQEQGSALTYARRYSLLMAFGLATEDDDAQMLSRPKETGKNVSQNKYAMTKEQTDKLALISKLNILISETDADRAKIYDYYKVDHDADMTVEQLKEAISELEKRAK